MPAGRWVGLFSGGKDSSYAVHRAMDRGLPVGRLLTVHPSGDSYMYHTPATSLTTLAAESMGLPLTEVEPGDFGAETATDAGAQGDAEIEPLATALADLDTAIDGGVAGVAVGAVASQYQATRVETMAERLAIDVFAPLWGRDPTALAREMLAAGFEILIVGVAAAGLDETWLGRRYDDAALADLEALNDEYGVHVLGEGGEFETLVTDGPHMDRRIELAAEQSWDGVRGELHVQDAWLE